MRRRILSTKLVAGGASHDQTLCRFQVCVGEWEPQDEGFEEGRLLSIVAGGASHDQTRCSTERGTSAKSGARGKGCWKALTAPLIGGKLVTTTT